MPNYFIFNLDLWVHETIVENYPQDPQLLGWEIDAFCIVNTRATNLLLARCTSPSAPNWPFCDLQFEIPGLETNWKEIMVGIGPYANFPGKRLHLSVWLENQLRYYLLLRFELHSQTRSIQRNYVNELCNLNHIFSETCY